MDSIRYQTRGQDLMMEDRYRRLQYEAATQQPQYWAQSPPKPVAITRFKRHLPAIPKKKGKDSTKKTDHFDVSAYAKHYKDKYGSVSAHSTSAIYGALRAPHYHAIYGPSNMWYASVRSLNRSCPREMYPPESYEWRETLYEDITKEGFPVSSPVEVIPGSACACVVRRRVGHETSLSSHVKSSRQQSRCKYCANGYPSSGPANGGLLSKKSSVNPVKPPSLPEEDEEGKPEPNSRMSGYKKCVTRNSKFKSSVFKGLLTKDSEKISRKSILECDVTAYDLIKKVAKTPISEIDDSDNDDNLSDNAIARMNQDRWLKLQNKSKISATSGSTRHIANKRLASKIKNSQSDNYLYTESQSVMVGGQRIFTDNHRSKSSDMDLAYDSFDDGHSMNCDSDKANWRKLSASEDSICIPDPDYDYSDESDDGTVIAKYRDPKFTYSPPPLRKSNPSYNGLVYGSREISKSMSSLLSDDTYIPHATLSNPMPSNIESLPISQNCDNQKDIDDDDEIITEQIVQDKILLEDTEIESEVWPPVSNVPQELNSKPTYSKYESSSDCSSSGGTLSSEYPTWTSSSSNELKSILKKKRRRDNVIQEPGDADRVFQNSKDSPKERKKQVQFLPGCDETFFDNVSVQDIEVDYEGEDVVAKENINEENLVGEIQPAEDDTDQDTYEAVYDIEVGINGLQLEDSVTNEESTCRETPSNPSSPLPPLSSSLEDVAPKQSRRSRKLPRRRFSDLHLPALLCPTKGSLCGDGSSSEDVPLTDPGASPQIARRSLPDSPSELDNFSFELEEKGTKEKGTSSRSVFYVPVDSNEQSEVSEACEIGCGSDHPAEPSSAVVSPSSAQMEKQMLTPESADSCNADANLSQYETDDDILENEYENLDPIYEELSDVSSSSKRGLTSLECKPKSFFEGASKIDILSYLEDAKERGLTEVGLSEDEKVIIEEEEEKILSGEEEDPGEKSRVIEKNNINHKTVLLKIEEDAEKEEIVEMEDSVADTSKSPRISEVERNDSGVGTETSKPSRMKQLLASDWEEQLCADCDHQVEPLEDEDSGVLFSPLVCRKCEFRRCERKEIIIEFVDTELKYGRDLRIIKDEFYRPMEIAGLLAKDQIHSIFLNLNELLVANTKFSEKLQDALDIAMEHGDEDYTTVNLGKIFLESSSMLHAFETYCVKQAPASVILSTLEKEKELLRIFLRVSQMENTLLRRMNLPAFLMVPVQRVTRFPLLLTRLHKVTPIHHKDRNALKEAQQKVELHLEHINQQTKGVGGTKIWRRISNISASHRRLGKDIGSIKLRKMALEVLNWKQDETRFVMAGKLMFTQITDYPWNKKGKTIKFTPVHALLIALGKPNSNYRPEISSTDNTILFPRNTGIRDVSLVLMKEKSGRFVCVRDPLYLGNCVISCEPDCDEVFEVQEYTTKEAYLLKGESKKETKEWLRQLRYHAKDLGSWRKRRNALANIMINGMIRQ
ncbi:hypothetical protein JTE90_004202 [Oedothorax gibbosus]|uniref:Myosin-M heavy chain n=1 Tax=Oedothorax gibbosus TaxID=931172 RepID=A0AAV6V2F7_9ARAC|nr:hypothetical protein JTE90_004202 [Oedothorax gibbosus]